MSKNILKVFHLQDLGFSLITWEVTDGEIHLKLKAENQASCPLCGHSSFSRYERGKWRKVYHGFGFGRKVYLLLRKDRYVSSVRRHLRRRFHWFPLGRGGQRRLRGKLSRVYGVRVLRVLLRRRGSVMGYRNEF